MQWLDCFTNFHGVKSSLLNVINYIESGTAFWKIILLVKPLKYLSNVK